jgi:hypothetical protein
MNTIGITHIQLKHFNSECGDSLGRSFTHHEKMVEAVDDGVDIEHRFPFLT